MAEKKVQEIYIAGNSMGDSIAFFPPEVRFYDHTEGASELEALFDGIKLGLSKLPVEGEADIYLSNEIIYGYLIKGWAGIPGLAKRAKEIEDYIGKKKLNIKFKLVDWRDNISGLILKRHLAKEARKRPGWTGEQETT